MQKILLDTYTTKLIERDGIFFASTVSEVSYPESGNENCFQVEENSFWFNHRNNCIIEAVKKYCPNDYFFDVGGGNGFVAKGLEENGISTVLIEPGVQGCLNARNRSLKNIICSTLENAGFNKGTIPAMGLFDVVEHIENDVEFLKSIHAFLKDNGFVFISVPAFNILWSKADVDAGHFRRYTLKEIESKLKDIGFIIEYSTYIFSILPLPIFLFRTIPYKIGLNKDSNIIDKYKGVHKNKRGITNKVMKGLWNFELNKIKNGLNIFLGGSCLIVARKING